MEGPPPGGPFVLPTFRHGGGLDRVDTGINVVASAVVSIEDSIVTGIVNNVVVTALFSGDQHKMNNTVTANGTNASGTPHALTTVIRRGAPQ